MSRAQGSGCFCHRAHFTDEEAEARGQQHSQHRGVLAQGLTLLEGSGPGARNAGGPPPPPSCSQAVLLPPWLSGHGPFEVITLSLVRTQVTKLTKDTETFTVLGFSLALNKHKSNQ